MSNSFNKKLINNIRKGKLTSVKELIDKGANVNYNNDSKTALGYACYYGHFDIVKFLLESGAYIRDDMAILYAAQYGHSNIVEYLIEYAVKSKNYDTGLTWSVLYENIQVIKELIENNKVDVSSNNSIALVCAAIKGNLEIIKMLVENGADIHVNCDYILRNSISNGFIEVIKYLVEKQANFEHCVTYGVHVFPDIEDNIKKEMFNYIESIGYKYEQNMHFSKI